MVVVNTNIGKQDALIQRFDIKSNKLFFCKVVCLICLNVNIDFFKFGRVHLLYYINFSCLYQCKEIFFVRRQLYLYFNKTTLDSFVGCLFDSQYISLC